MKILLFEDSKFTDFYPLSKTRPLHFLRCGAYLLYEKFFQSCPQADFYFQHRPEFSYLHNNLSDQFCGMSGEIDTAFIAINIRLLCCTELVKTILSLADNQESCAYGNGDFLHYGYFSDLESFNQAINQNKFEQLIDNDFCILNFPWDLVNYNGNEITNDYHTLKKTISSANNRHFEHVILIKPENMLIDESVKLNAGVVIDATKGPVILDKNVTVMHNSVIIGPCYIGQKCTIKIASKIYENCSFGPVCKIGGEVEDSIIHGYSNKQHDGFLGHAYIGEWCNLGADTNNSDLKNNYSSVMVKINGRLVDSSSLFVGLFMGDHSKSGINTMFNTGTVVGVCCSVFGEGFPEREIPDFHWGGKGKTIKYPLNKTIETVAIVKQRRKQELTDSEITILKRIYET